MIPLQFFVFMRKWWRGLGGLLLGMLIAFPLGTCSGAADMKDKMQAEAKAQAAAQAQRNAAAIEAAAQQRVQDILANEAKSTERTNAIHAGPDGRTSIAECRLNRVRLRQAGIAESKLPACQ